MTHDPSDDDDDRVGYGRPPRHTRWKKGQSGNPSGKRKRDESLLERLNRIAAKEVQVYQNGSQTVMRYDEALLHATLNKGLNGNVPAAKLILENLAKANETASLVPEFVPTDADIEVLQTEANFLGLVEQARAVRLAQDDDEGGAPGDAEDDHGAF